MHKRVSKTVVSLAITGVVMGGVAIAQVAPATILKISTQNFTIYLNDETDFAKLATFQN